MALARYVVDAVLVEGRSHREAARAHAVSKSWVAKVIHGSEKVEREGLARHYARRHPRSCCHRSAPRTSGAALRRTGGHQRPDQGVLSRRRADTGDDIELDDASVLPIATRTQSLLGTRLPARQAV